MTWPIGKFLGEMPWLQFVSSNPRDYRYLPEKLLRPSLGNAKANFAFQRASGLVIEPDEMDTDAGSIPRFLWSLPDLDPFTYLLGYLCHDWGYTLHHAGDPRAQTFEETNNTLAEAIVTMQALGLAPGGHRQVQEVYDGVSGIFGRIAWAKSVAEVQASPVHEVETVLEEAALDKTRIIQNQLRSWYQKLKAI